MAANRPRCPDCEAPEGELHALFCTQERCPFCGGQLASCGCMHQVLTLNEEERKAVEEYIDDSVEPLRGIMKRWQDALTRKGRVPRGLRERVASGDRQASGRRSGHER